MRHPDAELIEKLGGPARVADTLGFTKQRVQNWMRRGIPAFIRLKYQQFFDMAA